MKKTYGLGFQKQYVWIEKEKKKIEEMNGTWEAYGLSKNAREQICLLMADDTPLNSLREAVEMLHNRLCGFGSDISITDVELTGTNGSSSIRITGRRTGPIIDVERRPRSGDGGNGTPMSRIRS